MDNKKNDSEIILYSTVFAYIYYLFVPSAKWYFIFGGILLGCIYRIADIISKSDYMSDDYVSKENVKYFDK